ncbi:MAG: FAD-binding and (Fe-S)-binding domain-containing protein [Dermatophilaceae bacterium]
MTPTKALTPAHAATTGDRAPEDLADGADPALVAELAELVGAQQVLSHVSDLVRYATDASPYRMVPQAVVVARHSDDVAAVLRFAERSGRSVVFRAGGTSLSGQSQSDDLLVDVRKHWSGLTVLDEGRSVRVRPGTTVGQVNAALKPYGRVLGPDPASSSVACIGGVVSNNASGMAAGTMYNSYKTVTAMTFVLPNGAVIDTAAPGVDQRFAAAAPELNDGLMRLRGQILADTDLTARLRRKYAIKNTNGYRMIAFLDGDTPVEIFRRLLIGSEGTLGFIAEVVFDTVPLGAVHSTGLLLFPTLEAAAATVPAFVAAGARAVELMDAATLRLSAHSPLAPISWSRMTDDVAGLLVEFRAPTLDQLAEAQRAAAALVDDLLLWEPAEFTSDDATASFFWYVRANLMAGLGKNRPPGTTLIVEDVCVPPDRVAQACKDILGLLVKYDYPAGVAGHASAGNLHFILALDAASATDRTRYTGFMVDLVDLIVGTYDGSLKAEHGTGRNMSPFLAVEWGEHVADMMWQIKALADPHTVLAPGVMLNHDRGANLQNLKTMPAIEAVADACFECGFCEQVCPSRDLTTTPRQRIALRREMVRQPTGSAVQEALLERYTYDAVQTCAGDSSCASACPVDIDTGAMMKQFRTAMHNPSSEKVAAQLAHHFGTAERLARLSVAVGTRAGDTAMDKLTAVMRAVISHEVMPAWVDAMPGAAAKLPQTSRAGAAAVYFPACINRIFGNSRAGHRTLSLPEALVTVSARAERPLWIPADVTGSCCATVWHSKGYEQGNRIMAERLADRFWKWSDHGRLPVVIDASSCSLGATTELLPYLDQTRRDRHQQVSVVDSLTWAARELLPRLTVTHRLPSATVHATCSMNHLGVAADLLTVAGAVAERVHVPASMTCCAFAGDRGMLHPELTASATAAEAAQVADEPTAAYMSANRTCEVGLEQATGRVYESAIFALESATRMRPAQAGAWDER